MVSIVAIHDTLINMTVLVQRVQHEHPEFTDLEIVEHVAHEQGSPVSFVKVPVLSALKLLKSLESQRLWLQRSR